jgi:ABC-type multidrug transport system ATPase subunit
MLHYTALLKRSVHEPAEAKAAVVESAISRLGLSRCADVRIGNALVKGISGGQAKRTNIGLALVSSPRVLFLDGTWHCFEQASGMTPHMLALEPAGLGFLPVLP